MALRSSQADGAAQMVARHFAWQWAGFEAEADQLRQVMANWIYDTLQRVDAVSEGAAGSALVRTLRALVTDPPDAEPIFSISISAADLAAQRFVRVILGFLPTYLRSLDALLQWIDKQKAGAPKQKESAAAASPRTPTRAELDQGKAILQAMLPITGTTTRWPTVKGLGDIIDKAIKSMRSVICASALKDLMIWAAQVPLMAAASEEVAQSLYLAFKALDIGALGIVKSSAELGSLVHSNFETRVAEEFVLLHQDRYLIADQEAYLPPSEFPISIEALKGTLESIAVKDYSVSVLLQARAGKLPFMIRAKGTETSREDLVVFTNEMVPSITTSGFFDGRPEVYELKSIDSVIGAVPQVTAYSWNYLIASIYLQCTFLPRIPNARVLNTVMIPASPEARTISLPVITVTELAKLASGSAPQTAAEIVKFVTLLVQKSVRVAWYLAVPFMVTGLYGVIPYFVIDLKKLKAVASALAATVATALAAALAAYLKAKRKATEFWEPLPDVVKALIVIAAVVVLAIIIILSLPGDVVLVPAAGAAAAAIILIVLFAKQAGGDQGPGSGPPEGTIQVGPLAAMQCTPKQFAAWMETALTWYGKSWSAQSGGGTVNVAPLL
jgi:hypothetical protein